MNEPLDGRKATCKLLYVDTHFTQRGWIKIRRMLRERGALSLQSTPDTETIKPWPGRTRVEKDQRGTIHAPFSTRVQAEQARREIDDGFDFGFDAGIQDL